MAAARRLGLLVLWLPAACAAAASEEGDDAVCSAESGCAAKKGEYFWPTVRGSPAKGIYSNSNVTLPGDLKKAHSWSWHHPAGRQGTTVLGGNVVDDEKNIYMADEEGIRKFRGSDGAQLWHYAAFGNTQVPSIWNGLLYVAVGGRAVGLNMQTGKEVWDTRLADDQGKETPYTGAIDGRAFFAADIAPNAGNKKVFAVNATSGDPLWEYCPHCEGHGGLWNFYPVFPGDQSVLFMTWTGGVFKLAVDTGKVIWHSPPPEEYKDSFTDGGVILGPDGTAYSCTNKAHGGHGTTGAMRAYRGSDGKLLWDKHLHLPCTSWPAIDQDNSWGVIPLAPFVNPPLLALMTMIDPTWHEWPYTMLAINWLSLTLGSWFRKIPTFSFVQVTQQEVVAFDTKTGETIWSHRLPDWERLSALGDEEFYLDKLYRDRRDECLPAPLTMPTITADGRVWVGEVGGRLYGLKHLGGGKVDEDWFDTGGAFLHGGTAWAPGQMSIASCHGLYVFHF